MGANWIVRDVCVWVCVYVVNNVWCKEKSQLMTCSSWLHSWNVFQYTPQTETKLKTWPWTSFQQENKSQINTFIQPAIVHSVLTFGLCGRNKACLENPGRFGKSDRNLLICSAEEQEWSNNIPAPPPPLFPNAGADDDNMEDPFGLAAAVTGLWVL